MAVSPFSRWKKTDTLRLGKNHWPLVLAAPIVALAITWVTGMAMEWVALGVETLALWILFLLAKHFWQTTGGRLGRDQVSYVGMLLGHTGIAVSMLGVAITTYYSDGRDVRMSPGDVVALGRYEFEFAEMRKVQGPNYVADQGEFTVRRDGEVVSVLTPEKRFYSVARNVMTEADLDPGLFRDLYIALGEPVGETAWAVRLHVKPFVRWIWFGGLLIALGGFVTLLDRRYHRQAVRQSQVSGAEAAA
jgi:cytochrome c-type biogenesis protein CcmF